MVTVHVVLLVFAFVLFVLAAVGIGAPSPAPPYPRFNLLAAGLACWTLSLLLG